MIRTVNKPSAWSRGRDGRGAAGSKSGTGREAVGDGTLRHPAGGDTREATSYSDKQPRTVQFLS